MYSNYKYIDNSFEDTELLEKRINTLLNCESVYIDANYRGSYIYIDNLIKIEFKEGIWGIYYQLEYGPIDKFMVFQIEEHSLFAYQCLKKIFDKKPYLVHDRGYPSSEILVGFCEYELSEEFLKNFYEYIKIIGSYHLNAITNKVLKNKSVNIIDSTYSTFFLDLSVFECLELESELEYLSCIVNLMSLGFYIDDEHSNFNSLFNVFKKSDYNKELQVALSKIIEYEDKYLEVFNKSEVKAQVYVELQDYLILDYRKQKYIVEKEGYLIAKFLINKYNDSFQDQSEIDFIITDKYELLIHNNVFTVIQKAYVFDMKKNNIINSEINKLQNKLHLLNGQRYFDISEVIKSFEILINCENTKEYELEEFIRINYLVLLGKEYSMIKTQIMINYISKENSEERRFDVFAYNRVKADWDVFELKRSNTKMIKKIRGIPMFNSYVNDGIAQLRHYKELLSQDQIRKSLMEKYEIEIGNPTFTLLIGSSNNDDIKKCQNNILDIKVKTYTQMIEKARIINY